MAQPTHGDYQLHFYRQKLAAAEDEAARLFAEGNVLQQQLEAEKHRADEAEQKLAAAKGEAE